MTQPTVVIIGYARTPFARSSGELRDVPAHVLGALAVDEVLRRAGVDPAQVGGLYAGVGTGSGGCPAPARETVLVSVLADTTPSLAVDRGGCSGMTAIGLGWHELRSGASDLVVCGGYDSPSGAPAGQSRQRAARDVDPAEYPTASALAHGITSAMQEEWMALSHRNCVESEAAGIFAAERFDVQGLSSDTGTRYDVMAQKLAGSPPMDPNAGACRVPTLCDGAAFLLLATEKAAAKLSLSPIARLADYTRIAAEPATAATLPALSIRQLMKRQGRAMYELDLLEIHEDHAATTLVTTLRLGSRNPELAAELRQRTNVHGGALAMGDAPAASGARITMTLVNALARRGGGRAVAAICSSSGEAEALILEA